MNQFSPRRANHFDLSLRLNAIFYLQRGPHHSSLGPSTAFLSQTLQAQVAKKPYQLRLWQESEPVRGFWIVRVFLRHPQGKYFRRGSEQKKRGGPLRLTLHHQSRALAVHRDRRRRRRRCQALQLRPRMRVVVRSGPSQHRQYHRVR